MSGRELEYRHIGSLDGVFDPLHNEFGLPPTTPNKRSLDFARDMKFSRPPEQAAYGLGGDLPGLMRQQCVELHQRKQLHRVRERTDATTHTRSLQSLIHSLLTHSLTHSFIHSPTTSLTLSLSHPLTHPLSLSLSLSHIGGHGRRIHSKRHPLWIAAAADKVLLLQRQQRDALEARACHDADVTAPREGEGPGASHQVHHGAVPALQEGGMPGQHVDDVRNAPLHHVDAAQQPAHQQVAVLGRRVEHRRQLMHCNAISSEQADALCKTISNLK